MTRRPSRTASPPLGLAVSSQKNMETDDVNTLAAYIREKGYCRIGVDGTNGAGKSTFAAALASALGLCHLNLDDFLVKKRGSF